MDKFDGVARGVVTDWCKDPWPEKLVLEVTKLLRSTAKEHEEIGYKRGLKEAEGLVKALERIARNASSTMSFEMIEVEAKEALTQFKEKMEEKP